MARTSISATRLVPNGRVLKRYILAPIAIGRPAAICRCETVDPERWVPDGFVVVTVQSRGTGKSPGYFDPYSPAETRDYAEAIDWAGIQSWSNGKVGLSGVSYFATKLW